ncbi:speckle-type POZ protein-like [Planococcus citri]|uniref:speckle-type POZ protein-like n=1 Tax=Planococcus citri TaxID=170843 RepID=UPI0031F97642
MDSLLDDSLSLSREVNTLTSTSMSNLHDGKNAADKSISSGNAPVAESWCETEVKFEKCSHIWTINHYRFFHDERGELLLSSMFSAVTADKYKWILVLYPKNKNDTNYISLYLGLKQTTDDYDELFVKFKFSVLDAERNQMHTLNSNLRKFTQQSKSMGYPRYLERNYLFDKSDQLLPGDRLTIYCEVTFAKVSDICNTSGQLDASQLKTTNCNLSDNLQTLVMNEELSDVKFRIKGKDIPAHKAILAARSPVFAAMLKHDMQEGLSNCIEITDIDQPVFEELLWYIYTGKAPRLKELAAKLLVAADKYDIERLKVICEEALCSDLTLKNSTEYLILADLYRADRLKSQAIHYTRMHAPNILKTSAWKTAVSMYPHIAYDICNTMLMREGPPHKRQRMT